MSNWLKRLALLEVSKFKINYSKLHPKNLKKVSFKKVVKGLAVFFIFLAVIITIKDEIMYEFKLGPFAEEEYAYDEAESQEEKACNVAGIQVHGDLVTYIAPNSLDKEENNLSDETSSENVIYQINEAQADNSIKAIILEVDSYGGSAIAAQEIAQSLKGVTKPTVVLVRSAATSAAYWASTGANAIFASALSDIGSIAVTASYIDGSKKNLADGLTFNSLSTGKFKDYGNPDKNLSEEEKVIIMRDLNITHKVFVKAVADNRNLDINKVNALADGSSMPGEMALEKGLIDRIGGMNEVKNYLKDKIGEEVGICW